MSDDREGPRRRPARDRPARRRPAGAEDSEDRPDEVIDRSAEADDSGPGGGPDADEGVEPDDERDADEGVEPDDESDEGFGDELDGDDGDRDAEAAPAARGGSRGRRAEATRGGRSTRTAGRTTSRRSAAGGRRNGSSHDTATDAGPEDGGSENGGSENGTPRRKTPARKTPARKSPARKTSGRRNPDDGISPGAAARRAAEHIVGLTGRDLESVVSIERDDDEGGWQIGVEVVETRRIPDSADILALFEVRVDEDGELAGFRRVGRYSRGRLYENGGR